MQSLSRPGVGIIPPLAIVVSTNPIVIQNEQHLLETKTFPYTKTTSKPEKQK